MALGNLSMGVDLLPFFLRSSDCSVAFCDVLDTIHERIGVI